MCVCVQAYSSYQANGFTPYEHACVCVCVCVYESIHTMSVRT